MDIILNLLYTCCLGGQIRFFSTVRGDHFTFNPAPPITQRMEKQPSHREGPVRLQWGVGGALTCRNQDVGGRAWRGGVEGFLEPTCPKLVPPWPLRPVDPRSHLSS